MKFYFQTLYLNPKARSSFINPDLIRLRKMFWASLVTQWLRICLPMQETRVRSLAQEDPTCRGATKPMCHNY